MMADRVVVAMSGGVDSSVAAALLMEQGYDVIGVMLRLWVEPPLPGAEADVANRCCSLESLAGAQAVADRLDIPFYVINAEEPFRREVVDFFIREYAAGRTPNPCLICNRKIRFGYLLEYARSLGARWLATGHYARIRAGADGKCELWRGVDPAKDQSYVLSVLGQDELRQVLFPVGEHTKSQVRALAAGRGLPTASRPESQDLCFVVDGDYRRFLTRWAPDSVRPGPILDRRGRRLGTHRGLPFYTVGQRSGLGIAAPQPLYVLELQAEENTLIVGAAEELGQRWLRAAAVNWIAGDAPRMLSSLQVQIRYRAQPVAGAVVPKPDGSVEVALAEPLRGVTPGQAVVFYRDEICLGGGMITEARGREEPGGEHVRIDALD
jgi:tRNA-uridine 2-sulfurtransferase